MLSKQDVHNPVNETLEIKQSNICRQEVVISHISLLEDYVCTRNIGVIFYYITI